MEPTTATPQSSGPSPGFSRVTAAAAAEQAQRLLTVLAWMRASRIRPATLETLLAVAAGANTPQEIRQLTAHTLGSTALPGLSRNGLHVGLTVLLGAGQGHQRGRVRPPRCEPMLARAPDPDAGRERCWRYRLTPQGIALLETLLGPVS